jgi:hypothetical protein
LGVAPCRSITVDKVVLMCDEKRFKERTKNHGKKTAANKTKPLYKLIDNERPCPFHINYTISCKEIALANNLKPKTIMRITLNRSFEC